VILGAEVDAIWASRRVDTPLEEVVANDLGKDQAVEKIHSDVVADDLEGPAIRGKS
jgi:hypothetical protein